MISKLLIRFYCVVHGKWHLPGAGWLIRHLASRLPGLWSYPLRVPEVGTALLDFRDGAAFGMLNLCLGEFANDRYLFSYLEQILKPGDVFWDIGANVGFVSQYFAHPRYKLSSVHCFEPNPTPLRTLQSLFAGHPYVVVHAFGLGNKDEIMTLNLSAEDSSLTGTIGKEAKNGRQIKIQIRKGDDARRELQLPDPNVIKIDVEGFEPNVFAGLNETITDCRPVIIFEHIWLTDEQIKQFLPTGYFLCFIHDDGIIATDFSSRLKGHDAILVPEEKSDLIRQLRGV